MKPDLITAASMRCADARKRVIAMSYQANSAHLGSSLSCIELLDALLFASNITPLTANAANRDRLVFSKGHAAMGFYACLEQHGLVAGSLLDHYLNNGTALWGHVTRTPEVPAVDASTGSLGHGLSLATGYALANCLRHFNELRSFCVMSDGECDEGATWEAAMFAGSRRFDRLVAIVDYNRIQSLGMTADIIDLEPFADKWRSFNWETVVVDGHDWAALYQAISAPPIGLPRVIVAMTVKGRGIARIENTVASHYHPARRTDLVTE